MSNPPNDRETLQQLLANAFAVQESHIDPRSLTAVMEIQRLLASGKLDIDSVMAHIVHSTGHVANASGVAVALLKRDCLTYRAGTGSSESLIGHQVTASLTVSPGTKTNCEILRVENAQTDTRIEADICRQFGANALLIVPIYLNGSLAGVLDVRFNEPHVFDAPEVRAYRLMAEQIEAALFHAAQFENQRVLTNEPALLQPEENPLAPVSAPAADDFEEIALLEEDFVPAPGFMMLPENEHTLYARCLAVLSDILQLPVFKQAGWILTAAARSPKDELRANRVSEDEVPESLIQELPAPEVPPQTVRTQEIIAADFSPQEPAEPQLAMQEMAATESPAQKLATQESAEPVVQAQEVAMQESAAPEARQELPIHQSPAEELPAIPPVIPATPAWRTRTSAWRENLRTTAQDASSEFSATFRRAAAAATSLAQRASSSALPGRLRSTAQNASAQFSSTIKRASASGSLLAQRAKNSTWPDRVRISALTAARNLSREVAALRKRTAASATVLTQRAQDSNWTGRLRRTAQDASTEFSSTFRRAASSTAAFTRRTRNILWTNRARDLALTAAVLFALTALIAYRSHGPVKPVESSTLPKSAAAEPQPQLPKPDAARDASTPPQPLPEKTTARAGSSLRRVQVGPNEVDYIGDDVTIRTFPDRSRARRPRLAATHTAQFGDDVTVRYFTPPPPTTKTASR
ncbi:MAG TPA: GAF domain-containing protein [Candidatus Sulfotelmatobacter sp.]|nr:GAF domain-containing protein [Candidatus Sulfotelmatobacter sp.]